MFGEIYSVLNPIPYGWDYEGSLGKAVSANPGLSTAVVLKKRLAIPWETSRPAQVHSGWYGRRLTWETSKNY